MTEILNFGLRSTSMPLRRSPRQTAEALEGLLVDVRAKTSPCADTNASCLTDEERPWGAIATNKYDAFVQMQMSFSAICTLSQGSPGWRQHWWTWPFPRAPQWGLEWTITVALPTAVIRYPQRPSSPVLANKISPREWKRLHRNLSSVFYFFCVLLLCFISEAHVYVRASSF